MKLLILIGLLQISDTIQVHYGDPKYFDFPNSLDYELKTDLQNGIYVAYDTTWAGKEFLKFTGELQNKKKVGSWKHYSDPIYGLDSYLERKDKFDDGYWLKWTEYFENGKPRWQFRYPPKSEREADWNEERMWYENGKLKFEILQPKGEKRYKQKAYYESGQLQYVGYFDKYGRTAGVWTHYYENGRIEKVGTYCSKCLKKGLRPYFHGIPIGEWKYFSEEGKLIRTENHQPKKETRGNRRD